jgi:heme exporter protein D
MTMAPAPTFPENLDGKIRRSPIEGALRTKPMRLPEDSRDFKLHELTMLSITPVLRRIHHWWLERTERHYLICADVEQQRAREAQMNAAYYQKRAALARAARY